MKTNAPRRRLLGGSAALIGAIALTLAGASTAHAHVSVNSNTAEEGSYAILEFSVPHGCEASPTTSVAIQIPAGINSVTATRNAFYTLETVTEILETPITDGHGAQVTERVSHVIYTANTPLPSHQRDTFELSLRLPEDAAGNTLYFPTIQTCVEGETAWAQIPAEGQDPHSLATPAPALTITASTGGGHHGHDDGDSYHAHDGGEARDSAADNTLLIVAFASLAIGTGALITALIALARGRKKA